MKLIVTIIHQFRMLLSESNHTISNDMPCYTTIGVTTPSIATTAPVM